MIFLQVFFALVKLSAVSTVAFSFFLAYRWVRRDRTLDSIPGPKSYPFIGTFPVGPPLHTADVFRGFAREYGELFKFQMGWYNWVAVNSPEAMKELFDKQVRPSQRPCFALKASDGLGTWAKTNGSLSLRPPRSLCRSPMALLRGGCECSRCPMALNGAPTGSLSTSCCPRR